MLQRVDADGSGNIDFAEFSKQAALKLQLVAQGLRKESEEETAEKLQEPQNAKALSMLNSEGTIAQMRQDPALKGRSKHIQDRMSDRVSRGGEWFNFGLPSKAARLLGVRRSSLAGGDGGRHSRSSHGEPARV